MTQDSAPITVPPELVQQWWDGTHGAFYEFEAVVTQAARWGADQELEACCKLLELNDPNAREFLYAARRPSCCCGSGSARANQSANFRRTLGFARREEPTPRHR